MNSLKTIGSTGIKMPYNIQYNEVGGQSKEWLINWVYQLEKDIGETVKKLGSGLKKKRNFLEKNGNGEKKKKYLMDCLIETGIVLKDGHISSKYQKEKELERILFYMSRKLTGNISMLGKDVDMLFSLRIKDILQSTDTKWKKFWGENLNLMRKSIIKMVLKTTIDLKTWLSFIHKNATHILIPREQKMQNGLLKQKTYGKNIWK